MGTAQTIINKFVSVLINPIIYVLFAAGLFLFVYGVVEFLNELRKGGNSKMKEGKDHMLWGLLGLFIMVGVFGIIHLISNTFGLGLGTHGSYNPDMSLFNAIGSTIHQ